MAALNENQDQEIRTEEVTLESTSRNGSELCMNGGNWMPLPQQVSSDCPAGLEYLNTVDQIIVNQLVEVLEAVSGFEKKNKYLLKNSHGETMYNATEDSTCCMRQCCGNGRAFELSITTNTDTEVVRLVRPLRCDCLFACCCLQQMEVQSPPGQTIGWIRQSFSVLSPCFLILDDNGELMYKIKGPWVTCKWCDAEFHIMSADEKADIGSITRQWSGLAKEYFSDAGNCGIRLPVEMDVKMKAVLVGALFLIDFMYFES